MKKRIISLVLVGVLTLSILGGCGKKEIPLEESTTESTD
jgi:arabinogalactan oligomer/maltooligosaccharide transport system substrate-binding protein